MTVAASCHPLVLHADGRAYTVAPYDGRFGVERCSDCGVTVGGHHHTAYCDQATCPRCGEQLIGIRCGCQYDAGG
jgi:predicted RNA-binding Zn-ribbon protein involved in translation (DUF1610 family)